MQDVSPEQLAAARVVLTALWSATVPSPDAFAAPRFQWPNSFGPRDPDAAARHLATLRKPVAVEGRISHPAVVEILEMSPNETSSACCLADLLPEGSRGRLLILSGGRALRTGRAALEIACADYRLRPNAAAGGSPPDDAWTTGLQLPRPWLEDVSFVVLLGQSLGNQSLMPVRMGDGWSLDHLDDV
jgi:hypothetical protein